MDTSLVMEYLKKRMEELGYGDNFTIRFRHIVITALQTTEIGLGNNDHLYVLTNKVSGVTIESTFGFYDLGNAIANELQYEHQGKITITNYSTETCHVRFVQAIPKN